MDTLMTGGYIFSYANPEAVGGGFEVVQLKDDDTTSTEVLLAGGSRESIQYVQKVDSFIGIVRYDFQQNTLRTTFLYSLDFGKHWDTLNNPLSGLRKFLTVNGEIFIEGDLGGATNIFRADRNWQNWAGVDLLSQGFKYISFVSSIDKRHVLCEGSESYNHKNSKLILFDIDNESFKDLLDIDNHNGYIKPVSADHSLHAIINSGKIELYSFHDDKMHLLDQIKKPRQTDYVRNLYVSDSLYIISSEEIKSEGKTLSWISYDKGDTWLPFYHNEEYRMVTNDFGSVIMIDKNNNVFHLR